MQRVILKIFFEISLSNEISESFIKGVRYFYSSSDQIFFRIFYHNILHLDVIFAEKSIVLILDTWKRTLD